MKKMTQLDLSNLGIIDIYEKQALEDYVDSRAFRQRKTYSEYYIDWNSANICIDIQDLMILAERFKVEVNDQDVTLFSKN